MFYRTIEDWILTYYYDHIIIKINMNFFLYIFNSLIQFIAGTGYYKK